MKKFLSCILSVSMIFSLVVSSSATVHQVSDYPFSDDIIDAELSSSGLQPFTSENIIVMTEGEALELGSELCSIAQNCQLVYITGDVSPVTIAKSAGLPIPGEAFNDSGDDTVKDVALAIKYVNGDFIIEEIAVQADNLDSLLSTKKDTVMMDGIEAALASTQGPEVTAEGVQTMDFPVGHDMQSDKTTNMYDIFNQKVGTLSFYAKYYDRGTWTNNGTTGQMFDTIVRATFAPVASKEITKCSVTLGHLSTNTTKYADHRILDATYISTEGISGSETISLSLESLGAETSWTYQSDAFVVSNRFDADNYREWIFEPVNPRAGNAIVHEPGLRSMASGSGRKYTTIKLECPIYLVGFEVKNNYLNWNIAW